jgi:hypothetical protein
MLFTISFEGFKTSISRLSIDEVYGNAEESALTKPFEPDFFTTPLPKVDNIVKTPAKIEKGTSIFM